VRPENHIVLVVSLTVGDVSVESFDIPVEEESCILAVDVDFIGVHL
jgi:hypothetical protein